MGMRLRALLQTTPHVPYGTRLLPGGMSALMGRGRRNWNSERKKEMPDHVGSAGAPRRGISANRTGARPVCKLAVFGRIVKRRLKFPHGLSRLLHYVQRLDTVAHRKLNRNLRPEDIGNSLDRTA